MTVNPLLAFHPTNAVVGVELDQKKQLPGLPQRSNAWKMGEANLGSGPFPWASADSGSWFQTAGYGKFVIPRVGWDGKFDYATQPLSISITDDAINHGGHFGRLGEFRQASIARFLNDVVGVDLTEARYSSSARRKCRLKYSVEIERLLQPLRIYHVTDLAPGQERLLNECGIQNLMVSYNKLRRMRPEVVDGYLAGLARPPKVVRNTENKRPSLDEWQRQWKTRRYWDERAIEVYERLKRYESFEPE